MRNRTLAALVAGALALAGCGGRDAPTASGPAVPEVLRAHPAFDDIDPHDGIGGAPRRHAVHGIDVSKWQTSIDWPQARSHGVAFAFIKATEGGDLVDPMFETHWQGAGAAGVRRSAYHFFYFCRPAEEQARWFIRHVPRDASALPHVLDMEWNAHSPTCQLRPDGATVRAEAEIFLSMLERHYGRRPMIYTTVDFWRDTGIGALPRTRFWLRSVAAHPRESFPGADWTFWQYTGTGQVPGIAGPVDLNVFAGSLADWARWPG